MWLVKTIDRLGVTVSRNNRRSKKRNPQNPEWSGDLPLQKGGKGASWAGRTHVQGRPPNREAESRPGEVTFDEAHGSGKDSSASGNK